MEIKDMNLEELKEKREALKEAMNAPEADLDAISADLDAIEARTAELKAQIEERNALAERITLGEEPTETIKTFEEEKREMEKNFAIDSVEYRDAWLKNLMGKQLDAEERTAITGTDAIPTETLNKIILRLEDNALIGKVDLLQIPGYVKIPVYATNNDAAWTADSTDSQDVIGSVSLQPKQLIKTVEVPATVDKMSISAFESYMVQALANKIEACLQKAIIAGTGTTEPTGILTAATSKTGTFTKAAATKADLLKIMGALPSDYQNGACWIMPGSVFYGEVMAIADHNDFVNINNGFEFKLFGKDVVLDDNCTASSKDVILYGQPKAYHVNLGEGIKVDADDSIGFRSNSRVYRGVCLADGNLDNSNAFVKYTRAAS